MYRCSKLYFTNDRTFKDIAKEHIVSIRSVQRWVFIYLENGISGLEMKRTGSSSQSRITDENKERDNTLSVLLFNDPNLFGYVLIREI
jgi:transposase